MLLSIIILIFSLAIILAAAELFTNGVEWLGTKLDVAEGAVGSVLAAVGTALPETTIAIVAVIAGSRQSALMGKHTTDAGIGAILGAPMMLATLAMFVTGAAVLVFARAGKREREMVVDYKVIGRDLRSFFFVYLIAMGAAFVPWRIGKIAIGIFLLAKYVHYVRRTFQGDSEVSHGQELHPLYFHRAAMGPHLFAVVAQLLVALGMMVGGAKLFLGGVTEVSAMLGISALVLSVIITPIATELPEKFNSVTWIRQRKDTLALGNISGAMVFQSSVTPAIGIFFTPWVLEANAIASIAIAVLATAVAWADMTYWKRISPYALLAGGALYALYPLSVFWIFPMLKRAGCSWL